MTLNKTQEQAVQHKQGALLILAGAGTGKTRVLTHRIAKLIEDQDAYASQILAVTFTNKASKEMKSRIFDLLGYESPEMFTGTFHSISARIFRKHSNYLGFSNDFNIVNQDDALRLVKRILTENKITDKINYKAILHKISFWKDKNILPSQDYLLTDKNDFYDVANYVYATYQEELKASNSLDFGDLILYTIKLLKENKDLQEYYSKKFKYILVDEYQDINTAQYLWLKLFCLNHSNICCVGDDDQSIYSFRGAEVENILRFEQDFPKATIIKLEENYRSTQHILNTANHLISHNKNRHKKSLFTSQNQGRKVQIRSNFDDNKEAYNICKEIKNLSGSLKEVAILVRASHQTRTIEENLINSAIPYQVIGGMKFYDRKEIRDIISYLRIIHSKNDILAFERIINIPKRGIGSVAFSKINNLTKTENISFLTAIKTAIVNNVVNKTTAQHLDKFVKLLANTKAHLVTHSLEEACKYLIENSGYQEMLKTSKESNAESRLENLQEFIRAIGEFDDLTSFLDYVSLINETQNNDNIDKVNILTLHSAKGLEFDNVFLTGWEEGLFPNQRALDEQGENGLEEERRLAYVGITRAKQNLYISYTENRRLYNKWQSRAPSMFLKELPSETTKIIEYKKTSHFNYYYQKPKKDTSSKVNNFSSGKTIEHKNFGIGTIKSSIGDVLEVQFDFRKNKICNCK